MQLDKKQVEHIARLARLGLAEDEKEKFANQLSSILDYVEKLNSIDTKGVEETAQVTGIENVMRPDEIEDWGQATKDALIAAAPEKEGRFIKTKPIL